MHCLQYEILSTLIPKLVTIITIKVKHLQKAEETNRSQVGYDRQVNVTDRYRDDSVTTHECIIISNK